MNRFKTGPFVRSLLKGGKKKTKKNKNLLLQLCVCFGGVRELEKRTRRTE